MNRLKASATGSANRSASSMGSMGTPAAAAGRVAARSEAQVVLPFQQRMMGPVPLKGRGAVTNIQGRYEVNARERFDDGWTVPGVKDGQPSALKTQVTDEIAKTILTRNNSPDIPFGVSLNPYRGCEHVNNEDLMRD